MGRAVMVAIFGAFTLAALGLIFATLRGGSDRPPLAFVVLWLFAFGWNAYWWLLRMSLRLTIQGEILGWRTAFTSGELPLSEIVAVRPSRLSSQLILIERRAGKPIMAMATKGNGRFLAELAARRPDLPIRVGWLAKLTDRLPGRSAFHEDK